MYAIRSYYAAEELFAILTLESHRHRCEIVGENLGTGGGRHHLPELDHVLQPVDHPRRRRLAIPAGTSGFLVIRLHGFRHVQMGDEADVLV